MTLQAADIFEKLSEWPHRGTGSEDEMMAREMLTTELLGEPGVDVAEEGLMAPSTYLPFFWFIAMGQAATILVSLWLPYVAILAGGLFLGSHILFFDWRVSPLIWLMPKRLTANLVAKKGDGERLIILMAHLDSAPASYAYRPEQVKHFAVSVYVGTFVVGLGLLVPLFDTAGYIVPYWMRILFALMVLSQAFIASMDFWRHGYTPGANDNLSGVAAATAAASKLWRHMPANSEVRLVITSAEEAGMLGAQHYSRAHEDELKSRPSYVLNFDTVGNRKIKFIERSGGFTPVRYEGALLRAAKTLCTQDKKYSDIEPGVHHVGDFDSVWFTRAGLPTLTIASYDEEGLMPHIHTPGDVTQYVDMAQVSLSAVFGEALVRLLPSKN